MRKAFGDDGFTLIEMPSGLTIDAERFSEFEASYRYFQDTKTFEDGVKEKLFRGQRPLVMCEGETDPPYFRTAAELLGMTAVATKIDFEWIGEKSPHGARGGGKDHLDNAFKFLRHNPGLVLRKVVLLYDFDAKKEAVDVDSISVRCLAHNPNNTIRRDGIENLLPESVFEERFWRKETLYSKSDIGTINRLQKPLLCKFLCEEKRDAADFGNFREPLIELERTLLGAS